MKKENILRKENINIALLILAGVFMLWLMPFIIPQTWSQTYNTTALVNTTVNITNSAPLIYAIAMDTPITLVAYNNKTVFCNVTVYDFDNDTLSVNATFYIDGVSQPSDADDGNNHYTNVSCARTTPQNPEMNYTCSVRFNYYADNTSNWYCNVTVADGGLVDSSNISNSATVQPLVAIKLPTLLDFGDLAVGQISNDTLANVTNAGNRDANISVKGYANTEGDGLAFDCDFGSIALNYERYDATNGTVFTSMTPLTSDLVNITNYYVPQRTSETNDSLEPTYWKVQIPVGAGGICEGKILFSAFDRGN